MVSVLVAEAVSRGVTVAEAKHSRSVRRSLAKACGAGSLSSAQWARVVDRLVVETRRRARSIAKCRRCSAPVRWVKTAASGSAMPLDPLPHPMGNVVLEQDSGRDPLAVVHGLPELPLVGVTAYRSHFVTCPSVGARHVTHGPTQAELDEVADARREKDRGPLTRWDLDGSFVAALESVTIRSTTWCLIGSCRWSSTGPAGDEPSGVPGDPLTGSEASFVSHRALRHQAESS